MCAAVIIDGKKMASILRNNIATSVAILKKKHDLIPHLAVIQVGDDPASQIYVRNKKRALEEGGMESIEYCMASDSSEIALLTKIRELNIRPEIHGILVQFPVPSQICQKRVIQTISPEKDVDGLHPVNVGRLASGLETLTPCTPMGCIMLAQHAFGGYKNCLQGLHALIIGRSHLVGKPLAQLLLAENATVTLAHSHTTNLPALSRQADLVIAAVGIPELVRGDWIKVGATVIDVGINRVMSAEQGKQKMRLVGDVSFEEVAENASHITPVPGGVGPMTIACLLRNTVLATCRQTGVGIPEL